MLGLILACAFAADTPTIIAKTLQPPIRTCFIQVPPFGSTGEGNDRVRPMFQLCRRRTQFKTSNLQRAAMRRGVSFANENPARVCDGLSSGGVLGTLVGGFGGGRDCGAAEIQRVLKMLPRWPDMNTSHSSSGPVTAAAWPSDKGHRETGEWRRSRADMHRRRATDAKHRAAQATELSIKSAFVGLAACW